MEHLSEVTENLPEGMLRTGSLGVYNVTCNEVGVLVAYRERRDSIHSWTIIGE